MINDSNGKQPPQYPLSFSELPRGRPALMSSAPRRPPPGAGAARLLGLIDTTPHEDARRFPRLFTAAMTAGPSEGAICYSRP